MGLSLSLLIEKINECIPEKSNCKTEYFTYDDNIIKKGVTISLVHIIQIENKECVLACRDLVILEMKLKSEFLPSNEEKKAIFLYK